MTQYYSQLTNYGEKYIAAQIGAGKPINLATMAVGDGNGQNTTPTATQTALVHEVYRANTTDVVVDAENPNQVICEFLIPENVGDFWVREIGIFDEKGKLVAIANTPENYKPVLKSGSGKVQYYRIILAVSSSDNIKITLNQNIIFVTRVELDRFKNELSDSDGFRLVGQCNSIEQLRTIEPKENNQRILVKGYYDGSNKGGGQFEADFNDTQSTDNGGTVIVTTGGKRWKRIYNTLSIFDFGGKIGFDVDNTDVIQRIEEGLKGSIINLCGGEFYSTVKPVKNQLINGVVQYSNQDTGATNYPMFDVVGKSHLYNTNSGEGQKFAELVPVSVDNNAPSYYTQGFEQDPVTGELWSMQSGDNNTNALVKYNFSLGQKLTNQGHVFSDELSHQSFGIFYRDGIRYFICQPHGAKGNQKAKYLNIFTINETKSPWEIENLKSIQVLPQAIDGIRALSVSPSGDEVAYLYGVDVPITTGTRYMWKIAIFNIDEITAGNVIPKDDFYIEKSFSQDKTTGKAIQDITFDGSFVYVLHGGDKNTANTIAVYTRKGTKLVFDENNKTGYELCKQIQTKGGSLYYEAEGLFLLRNSGSPMLCMSVISGNEKGKQIKNTHLFAMQDINQNIAFGSQSLPAVIVNADNIGIAFPNGKPLTFAELQEDGGYKPCFNMNSSRFSGEFNGTTQPQILLGNSAGRGMMQVSSSGNFGLYDLKKNNWLIGVNNNGRAFCQKDWDSNFRVIYDNDAEPKYRLTNSKRDGMLQISRSGNFGLYDITKNNWLISSGLDGLAFCQKDWSSNFRIIFGDTSEPRYRVTNSIRDGGLQASSSGNLGIYDFTNNKWVILSDTTGTTKLSGTPSKDANGEEVITAKWANDNFPNKNNVHEKSRFSHRYYQNHYHGAEVFDLPIADNAAMRITIMSADIDGDAVLTLPEAYNGVAKVVATDVGQGKKAAGMTLQNGNQIVVKNSGITTYNIIVIGYFGW